MVNIIKEKRPDLVVNFVETEIMNQLSYYVRCEKFSNLGFEFSGSIKNDIHETIELLENANSATSQS